MKKVTNDKEAKAKFSKKPQCKKQQQQKKKKKEKIRKPIHRILSLNPKTKQLDCYWETLKPKLIKIGSLIKYLKDKEKVSN